MPIPVQYNGSNYTLPLPGENYGWGQGVTSYLNALSSSLAPNTGLFSLTQELDFGPNWGVRSGYFKSRAANTAQSGTIALSNTDRIAFRNAANSADNYLGTNTSNQLTFNGTPLAYSGASVTSINVTGANGIGVSGAPITSAGTIALSLGDITPGSVTASGAISSTGNISAANFTGSVNGTFSGSVNGTVTGTHTGTSSGTNTGDQTTSGTGNIAVATGSTNPVISFTGILPVENGGSGVATLTGFVKANGTAPFGSQATISLATEVNGVLPVVNGGTGANSQSGFFGSYFPSTPIPAITGNANIPAFSGGRGYNIGPPSQEGSKLVFDTSVAGSIRWVPGSKATYTKLNVGSDIATITLPGTAEYIILLKDGTNAQTLRMPATTINGLVITIVNGSTDDAPIFMTIIANSGQTLSLGGELPGGLARGASISYLWNQADSVWYRIR